MVAHRPVILAVGKQDRSSVKASLGSTARPWLYPPVIPRGSQEICNLPLDKQLRCGKRSRWEASPCNCGKRAAAGRVRTGQPRGNLLLVFNRVSVVKDATAIVTKGGIVLPENSRNSCSVVLGSTGRDGEIQPTSVKGGDKVFHPKCRGPKAMLGNKDSLLFRDGATLGIHVIEVTLWCPGKLPILLKF